MSPYTHTLAGFISLVDQKKMRPAEAADAICTLFEDWPAQRRKELMDLLEESVTAGMRFKHLVAAIDEALFINAQDWQSTKH